MNDKEIAKELTLAAFEKINIINSQRTSAGIAEIVATMYKTLYDAVHTADND